MQHEEIKLGDRVLVRFPSLNKNGTLLENQAEIEASHYEQSCEVAKIVTLDWNGYREVKDSLLRDNPLWEKIGGACSSDPQFAHVVTREDLLQLMKDREQFERFRASMVTQVVAVVPEGDATFRPFFVNTEGYDYARYVGH